MFDALKALISPLRLTYFLCQQSANQPDFLLCNSFPSQTKSSCSLSQIHDVYFPMQITLLSTERMWNQLQEETSRPRRAPISIVGSQPRMQNLALTNRQTLRQLWAGGSLYNQTVMERLWPDFCSGYLRLKWFVLRRETSWFHNMLDDESEVG